MASGEPNWPIPMRAIGAQNLLTMPGGVTIAGYLHKRGGNQLQLFKWPLRYVIIHKGCVYYFKSSTSASSQGAFSLNGYNRVMRAAEETTSSNVFPFKMVHISKKHRTWYFSAASEEERKKWMLALRKEIDFYHEKKETITDLSDTGSDSDSFYGSVERPVDIKYVHNSGEDSWQDEDDDEEDYVKPDVDEDGAPSYPPPPIPKPSTEEEPRRSSISSITTLKPHLLSPSRGISDLDLTGSRKDSNLQNHRIDLTGIPPPIPSLPSTHKLSLQIKTKPPPPPPPAVNTMTDSTGKQMPRSRWESSYPLDSSQINPPSCPLPPRRVDATALLTSKRDHANCQIAEAKHNNPQHLIASNDLKEELNKRLRNASPSKVPCRFPPEKPPNRPNQVPPPLPPTKPSSLSKSIEPYVPATKLSSLCKSIEPYVQTTKPSSLCKSIEHNQPPPVPRMKPKISINNEKLDELLEPSEIQTRPHKAPTILPRLLTAKSSDSRFAPILRSPPDGQSFVDKTVESPIRPPRPQKDLYEEKDDSDSDYEKVPLPASVYVDTSESTDVERMFKDVDPRGVLNGLFCIRNSARSGKVLVAWDTLDSKLRNYRIYEKDSKVYLEGEILFRDVATLVEHYYGHPLPGHNTLVLKYAYGCSSNPR